MVETAAQPPLPTFVIAGAMRSGTTSLNRWLRGHDDVWMSNHKELHYFDTRWEQGVSLDDYQRDFAGWSHEHAIGEATPNYVFHPDAMQRLTSSIPDVRVVLTLRHPVDRAYSQYWNRRSRGAENRSFAEVVATEPEGSVADDGALLARGRYMEQIERTLRYLDRERLLVVLFDDLEEYPTETFAEVCRFIGVDDSTVSPEVGQTANAHRHIRSERVRNIALHLPKSMRNVVGRVNSRPEAYPVMDASLRDALCEHFRLDNLALAEWLGRDLSAWAS